MASVSKSRYEADKDYYINKGKRYKAAHLEKMKAYQKQYDKDRYDADPEKENKRSRQWFIDNPGKAKVLRRKINQRNKPKRNEDNKVKRKTDPLFRLIASLRCRIYDFLKGGTKKGASLALVGMPREGYLEYVKSTFWPGMTNLNDQEEKWEIDHTLPLEMFNKTDPDWQFKAFHWSNTQALWKDDNNKKRYRRDWTPLESKHTLPYRFQIFTKSSWSVILPKWDVSVK
jgi:flavodoxin